MEEQKNKNKEIKLEGKEYSNNQDAPKTEGKLTYEQLNNACVQLSQQNQFLKQRLQQAEKVLNTFSRLDYLFRVIECDHNNRNNSASFTTDFVEMCIKEIQELMTMPEESEDNNEGN